MALVVGTNSWLSVVEADTYFTERIDSEVWFALADDVSKEKYLISAFRWLRYDPEFIAPSSAEEEEVKFGQCEAALFLLNYSVEYDKRSAQIQSGVVKFQYSRWTENLGEVKKPINVINYFTKASYYNGGVAMIILKDDSTVT